ncbi:sugar ABC transporter substrate-binding protein [Microbacterium sp. UBA837]|uniref:sugar ABC transporter substrate-binding protein n=1 Tax=Microbacterium sp. UBA837 TaxID=1946956 RepID=UPI0018456166|nr:sugar ABC transporter substrate-binding protein [Microbacterium sp. UBA837]MEC8761771.1 sugar ABC transporter substrate-binding protein [Actinomycetota bacterium]HIE60836.1 sugar ABC transporter substrate-binding protein [Microbacterium sp.]
MNPRINSTRRRAAATLAVAAGLALVASGCASAEQGGAQSSDDEIVVGYSGYTLTNPYFAGLIKGLEEGAEEHDFRLIQTNSNGDNNTQASDIQNLVSQGADYIVVSPADASAIVPAVEAAAEAGVTMVAISDTIDSDAITFTVAMDHVNIGEQSAQGIVDFLTEKYGEPRGKVVEMQGIAGSAAGADRTKGFDNVISQYPDIEVVARADGGFDTDKTFQAMSTILQAHPDIDAVMNANDSEAQGSTKAIEAAGLFQPVGDPDHIFVTGNDAPAPAIADIRANRQDMTVASNPIQLAKLVMNDIARLVAGETVTGFIEWPGQIITPANIDSDEVREYGIWADEVG